MIQKPRIIIRYAAFLIIGICILLLIVGVHYAMVIHDARQCTIRSILPAVSSQDYPLQLSDLTQRQLDILLKVEDPRFFEHGGVDFFTPGAGITTITQSLVKKLYFKNFKPGLAKIRQTLIADFALDPLMTKSDQLRLFINTIYLGNNAIGFEKASQVYFQKPFKEISEDQYMSLVAMIIAPVTFDLKKYPERNQQRVSRIQKLVNGEYQPVGLFDLFYGKLDGETKKNIPPLSYFESYYE